ncbi:protein phosphatase 1 regulatory subunit 26 isoform X2 [Engystomops pustulosus]
MRRHGNVCGGRPGLRHHVQSYVRVPAELLLWRSAGLGPVSAASSHLQDVRTPPPPCRARAQPAREGVRFPWVFASADIILTARMFLLNAPPLAAFQTQWTPFGCTAPCRVPTSLPQSAQISADVEGAIDSPQGDESSLTVDIEYDEIMQDQNRDLHIDRGLRSSPVLQETTRVQASLIVPPQFIDVEEEGSDQEHLNLDSDSDEAIERGIEEAIQEYLKNKVKDDPLRCTPKKESIPKTANVKATRSNAPAKKSPVKMVGVPKVTSQRSPRCSSPDSVESDDSFEKSISQDIEQYLIEKKLQNNGSTSQKTGPRLKLTPIRSIDKPSPKLKGAAVKSTAESSAQCADLSYSSSDEGIEEAIQMYQMERSRVQESPGGAPGSSLEKAANISHCQVGKSVPEPKKTSTDHRKRKLPNAKAAASTDSTSKRACDGAEWNLECKSQTAAELMCAEAILDISKAILPSQLQTTVLQDKPALPLPPCVIDSPVDSDDSIEQEIRRYLVQKAQTGGLCKPAAKLTPKQTRSDTLKQKPLTNTKNCVSTIKDKSSDQKEALKASPRKAVDPVHGCSVNSELTIAQYSAGKTIETCDDSSKPHSEAEDAKQHIIQAMESLESSARVSGSKWKMYMQVRSNNSGDKSSSLDSDEDLDSAIKDLLRSKRKCKKRPKDGRPQCKKKVRFGELLAKPIETVSIIEQKDCTPKPLVKSCLVISNDPIKNSCKTPMTDLNLQEGKAVSWENPEPSPVSRRVESEPSCASKSVISRALSITQKNSSVNSNDSIEQEIRKFLAERAQKAAELSTAHRIAAFSATAPTCTTSSPATVRKESAVLSSSVTETILQKVREKDRANVQVTQPAIIQQLYSYNENLAPVARVQHPAGIAMNTTPVHSVIVKRESIVDPNRRPAEIPFPAASDRVLVKTGVNSAQRSVPVTGNFVAGLQYISGTEQQLLLSMGKAGTSHLATDFYRPAGTITPLGTCQAMQEKTLILEQPKVVQAPSFSLGAPMVRPALYVVTTKVMQETSALCLPINAATYDTALNLMSIQYCPSQVASPTTACIAPFTFQQTQNGETKVLTPAGGIPKLLTKARASEATPVVLDGDGMYPNVSERAAADLEAGASVLQRDEV